MHSTILVSGLGAAPPTGRMISAFACAMTCDVAALRSADFISGIVGAADLFPPVAKELKIEGGTGGVVFNVL